MTQKTAGAYLNLLICKDLDVHHTGNQSGNITVHARGWHSPSWFAKELGSLWVVPDGVMGRASSRWMVPWPAGCCLALGTASALHLEPTPAECTQPSASEGAQQSHEGLAFSWQWHHHKDWHKLKLFFSPKPFISRQCSGANWTWLCAKSELRLNQFRQR